MRPSTERMQRALRWIESQTTEEAELVGSLLRDALAQAPLVDACMAAAHMRPMTDPMPPSLASAIAAYADGRSRKRGSTWLAAMIDTGAWPDKETGAASHAEPRTTPLPPDARKVDVVDALRPLVAKLGDVADDGRYALSLNTDTQTFRVSVSVPRGA